MKRLTPLLLVLPAGLALGLVGARMVDSGTVKEDPRDQAADAPPAESMAYASVEADERPARGSDAPASGQEGDARPDLDWGEEYWPGEHRGVSSGAYDFDGDYFGDGRSAFDPFGEEEEEDPSGFAPDRASDRSFVSRGEAAQAALAAERAARDALRTAAEAEPPAPVPARAMPAPAPSAAVEPRTAGGDLPAIW
jgi:hypothetical protein